MAARFRASNGFTFPQEMRMQLPSDVSSCTSRSGTNQQRLPSRTNSCSSTDPPVAARIAPALRTRSKVEARRRGSIGYSR